MIIAQFQFPALVVHPVKGVEQVTLPYFERIMCSGYRIRANDPYNDIFLYGTYRGEATIIFSLKHIEGVQFSDSDTEVVYEKWVKKYLDSDAYIWVREFEGEKQNVNNKSDRCSQSD